MEKNMLASKGRRIIAVGNEAYDMFEKAPADIVVNSPMAFGMIANLELQEIALYSMMKKIDRFLGIGSDMFFSVPLDMTAIEKRAYYHVANGHWLRQNRVYMVEAPIGIFLAIMILPSVITENCVLCAPILTIMLPAFLLRSTPMAIASAIGASTI